MGPAILLFREYWILFLLRKLAGASGAKIKNKWICTFTHTPSWPKQGEHYLINRNFNTESRYCTR
jgi:hypothetical protein